MKLKYLTIFANKLYLFTILSVEEGFCTYLGKNRCRIALNDQFIYYLIMKKR